MYTQALNRADNYRLKKNIPESPCIEQRNIADPLPKEILIDMVSYFGENPALKSQSMLAIQKKILEDLKAKKAGKVQTLDVLTKVNKEETECCQIEGE